MKEKNNFGTMGSAAGYIHYFLTSNLLFYLSMALPGTWLIFTTPNLLNIIAIGFLFPGLAALVSCSIKYQEFKDAIPFGSLKYFIEGYKKNFKDTIKYSFIYAMIIFLVVFNIYYYENDISTLIIIALFVLTTLSTLIVTYMMVIAAKYQFKTRDLLRVSIYCFIMHFKITMKIFITYVVLFFVFPWVGTVILLLCISPIVYVIVQFASPVLEDIYEVFVKKPE